MSQEKTLAVIRRFLQEKGYSPSIRDLVREVPFSSTSMAAYYLNRLEKAGEIRRTPNTARSIVLVEE